MFDVMIKCLEDMSKDLKNPAAGCCGNPTCNVSLTPPFLERARCGGCGKFCDECGVKKE